MAIAFVSGVLGFHRNVECAQKQNPNRSMAKARRRKLSEETKVRRRKVKSRVKRHDARLKKEYEAYAAWMHGSSSAVAEAGM
jgi:hypothetical protein